MFHTAGFPLTLTWVNPLRPDPKGQPGLISQKEIHVSQWLVVESRVSRIEFGVSHATGVQTFYIMKLTLTLHDKTYSIEDQLPLDGYTVSELLDHFKGLLVNAGFHPELVDEYIDTDTGRWFEKNNFDDEIEAGINHETDPS